MSHDEIKMEAAMARGNMSAQGVDVSTTPNKQYGISALNPIEEKRYRLHCSVHKILDTVNSSSNRINQAAWACTEVAKNGATPLIRSDLDNAIRHSIAQTKRLRELKAVIFPAQKEETKPSAESETQAATN